jgi:hypothetical protein
MGHPQDPRVAAARSLAGTAEVPGTTGDLLAVLPRYRHAVRDLLDVAAEQDDSGPAW